MDESQNPMSKNDQTLDLQVNLDQTSVPIL